jgi:hypothetical protein
MLDDAKGSSEFAVEDFDGEQKPAASVNKIGALIGASLKCPSGSKRAKKELLLRDTSLSGVSSTNTTAMERMADSHNSIAVTFEMQTSMQNLKEQISALQMECIMHRDLANYGAARVCNIQKKHWQTKLDAPKPLHGLLFSQERILLQRRRMMTMMMTMRPDKMWRRCIAMPSMEHKPRKKTVERITRSLFKLCIH